MTRIAAILCAIATVGMLFWFFPLFHVVSRDVLREEREQKVFRAADFVKEFWTSKLMPSLNDADDAASVLTALRKNPTQARRDLGRSVGLGRSSLFFMRGSGTIVSIDEKNIGVSLDDAEHEPEVVLVTGLLFGNTVRDATGLLNGDNFSNSQQFNEISSELNRKIENEVLPPLKQQAKVGALIDFVGCAEVTNVPNDITPLKLVPLDVKFK